MMRQLRQVALLPFALAVALFVHAFTGEDHAVAGGHGPELVAALLAGIALWTGGIGSHAYRSRRRGLGLGHLAAECLPGGGRVHVVAALLALQGALAYAGIESSEGRLAAALHLGPLVAGSLFALGGVAFAALMRLLAGLAVVAGGALAGPRDERVPAPRRSRRRHRPLVRIAASAASVHRGRAPPFPIPS